MIFCPLRLCHRWKPAFMRTHHSISYLVLLCQNGCDQAQGCCKVLFPHATQKKVERGDYLPPGRVPHIPLSGGRSWNPAFSDLATAPSIPLLLLPTRTLSRPP